MDTPLIFLFSNCFKSFFRSLVAEIIPRKNPKKSFVKRFLKNLPGVNIPILGEMPLWVKTNEILDTSEAITFIKQVENDKSVSLGEIF